MVRFREKKEDLYNLLHFITLGRNFVLPVEHHRRIREDQRDIAHGVLEADTFVWAATKDQVIPGVLVRAAFRV